MMWSSIPPSNLSYDILNDLKIHIDFSVHFFFLVHYRVKDRDFSVLEFTCILGLYARIFCCNVVQLRRKEQDEEFPR